MIHYFTSHKARSLTMSLFLAVFTTFLAFGQTYSGKLVDGSGEALIGASVWIDGTDNSTSTDLNGDFSIVAKPGDVLRMTYVGFQEQSMTLTNETNLNIVMQEDSRALDEVVVIGYGSVKKSHLTGAVSKVNNEKLDQLPLSRADDALVGQVSGVNIAATEGEAGSAPTIRIRGTGSMVASSDPLIVVDGLIVDNDFLGSMDMNDVQSFEILKDAASSAIYGSRGANGVILITTKDGIAGKTKFTYNAFHGFKEALRSDPYDFSLARTAAAQEAALGELSDRTRYKQLIGTDRDWQDVIFDGGMITSHSLSARGGSDNTTFSSTFSYTHDEGVLLTDDFKRYNMNFKIRTKINDRLKFGASIAPSYTDRRRFDGSTHDILRQTPWLPLYHDEETIKFVDRNAYPDVEVGDYAWQRHFDNYDLDGDGGDTDISNTSNANPAAKVLERDRNEYRFKVFGSTFLEFKILDGLKFRTVLSGDYQDTEATRWQGLNAHRNGASNIQYDVNNFKGIHLVNENYLTYDREFGGHEINAVLGISAERWDFNTSSASATGYENDLIQTISGGTTITGANSDEYQDRFRSLFGRINYAYNYKYLASVSFRRDGSSRFGPENKYGVFPAASVGWVVSEEGFLQDSKIFDFLKLRVSYGLTGNNGIRTGNTLTDYYPYLALLGPSSAIVDGSIASGI